MNRRFPVIAIIATLPFVIGCAAGSARASKGLKTTSLQQRIGPGQLTPVEIGGEVTSFADRYMSLLTYVADLLFDQPLSPEIRATTYGFLLDTGYGVYTVASDPNPVVSLFDMVVLFHYSAEHSCGPPMVEIQHAAEPLSAANRPIGSD